MGIEGISLTDLGKILNSLGEGGYSLYLNGDAKVGEQIQQELNGSSQKAITVEELMQKGKEVPENGKVSHFSTETSQVTNPIAQEQKTKTKTKKQNTPKAEQSATPKAEQVSRSATDKAAALEKQKRIQEILDKKNPTAEEIAEAKKLASSAGTAAQRKAVEELKPFDKYALRDKSRAELDEILKKENPTAEDVARAEKLAKGQGTKEQRKAVEELKKKLKADPTPKPVKTSELGTAHATNTQGAEGFKAKYGISGAEFNEKYGHLSKEEKVAKLKELAEKQKSVKKPYVAPKTEIKKGGFFKKLGKFKKAGLIGLGVLLVGGIAAAVIAGLNKKDNNEEVTAIIENEDETSSVTEGSENGNNNGSENGVVVTPVEEQTQQEGNQGVQPTTPVVTNPITEVSVKRGDCVWNIARKILTDEKGQAPTNQEVAQLTQLIINENHLKAHVNSEEDGKWNGFAFIAPGQILKIPSARSIKLVA